MTLSLKHAFNSVIADDAADSAAGKVTPTRWNAEHTITGTANALFGFSAAGAALDLTGTSWNATDRRLTITSVTGPTLTLSESLAIGGATIGTNALAVTGTASVSGAVTGGTFTPTAGSSINAVGLVSSQLLLQNVAANQPLVFTADRFLFEGYNTAAATIYLKGTTSTIGWTSDTSYTTPTSTLGTIDTTLSRNAAGIIQFGTTAANAAGSWLATNGTLSGVQTFTDGSRPITLTRSTVSTFGALTVAGTSDVIRIQDADAGIIIHSAGYFGFSSTAGISATTWDTRMSRNAAGVVQFGTTATNAAGAWLATSAGIGTTPAISASTFLNFSAGTTAASQFRLVAGVAPTSPGDGDVWREDNTNTGVKIRINGVTKTITVS